jgi:hypothetical protein
LENENILTIDGVAYDRSTFNQDQQILDAHISKLMLQRSQLETDLTELEVVTNSLVTTLVNSLETSNQYTDSGSQTETNTVFNTVR